MQLQTLAMCKYLVLPEQPELLTSAGSSLQWTNFQFDWPHRSAGDACEPDGEYRYVYIPEAEAENAWRTFANVWLLVLLLNAGVVAVQYTLHAARVPTPALLRPPRLQFLFIYVAMPSLMQSSGFVLAHHQSLHAVAGWLSLIACLGICLGFLLLIRQGLVVRKLCQYDSVLARSLGYRTSWLPSNLLKGSFSERPEVCSKFTLVKSFVDTTKDSGHQAFLTWGRGETLLLYYFPLRLLARALQGFVLGIFVRSVPHCDDPAPAGSSAVQISLLLLLTGGQVVALMVVRPLEGKDNMWLAHLGAWCDFCTMICAAVIAFRVMEATYALIGVQIFSLFVRLLWTFLKIYRHLKRQKRLSISSILSVVLGLPEIDDRDDRIPMDPSTDRMKTDNGRRVMNPLMELSQTLHMASSQDRGEVPGTAIRDYVPTSSLKTANLATFWKGKHEIDSNMFMSMDLAAGMSGTLRSAATGESGAAGPGEATAEEEAPQVISSLEKTNLAGWESLLMGERDSFINMQQDADKVFISSSAPVIDMEEATELEREAKRGSMVYVWGLGSLAR
ncbi:hypothetical protein CYMTET_24152 [Cymbomonas tetramitiformis]|uniref:Uncharacterized protein n=1 Tax=Cymbomonas tetramitiformis TaxID=36881 RepID=A0AAE0FWQ3_9CHLO|nr:hypothetical protein CYMTET_24152 [Cymbomonas tetramitiformis]